MNDPFDSTFFPPMDSSSGGNGGLVPDMALGTRATGSGVTIMGARKVEVARRRSDVMAQLKEEANPRWIYSWEVKLKSGGKSVVEGISIKGAMAVMRAYGNCAVVTEDIKETATHLFIKGAFIDVERGFAVSRTWMQSKSQNVGGGIDAERAMMIRFAIGESKAHRSAVEHALEDYCDDAKRMAKSGLIARVENNRDDALAWVRDGLAKLKVDPAIVEAEFGHKLDKMPAEAVARIYTRINTCLDGYADVEDAFERTPPKAVSLDEEGVKGAGETAPMTESGVVKDTPAPKAKSEPMPETTARRPRIKLTFGGKEVHQSGFFTDVKQLLHRVQYIMPVDAVEKREAFTEIVKSIYAAIETAEPISGRGKLRDYVVPLIEAVEKKFAEAEEPEHDQETGEIRDPNPEQTSDTSQGAYEITGQTDVQTEELDLA